MQQIIAHSLVFLTCISAFPMENLGEFRKKFSTESLKLSYNVKFTDPIQLPDFSFRIDNDMGLIDLNLLNVNIYGICTIKHNLSINGKEDNRLEFDFSIGNITIAGKYDAMVKINAAAIGNFEFSGNGALNFTIANLVTSSSIKFKVNPDGKLEFETFKFNVEPDVVLNIFAENAQINGNTVEWDSINAILPMVVDIVKPLVDENVPYFLGQISPYYSWTDLTKIVEQFNLGNNGMIDQICNGTTALRPASY